MKFTGSYMHFEITENDCGRRIDRIARKFLKDRTLSQIYSAIRTGKIKLNGNKTASGIRTKQGDILYIDKNLINIENNNTKSKPEIENSRHKTFAVKNTAGTGIKYSDISIILRTQELLFVNKRRGQITHGKNSLDEAVKKYFSPEISSLSFSAGALHRLDKDTTGILAFSQNLKGARFFSEAMKTGKIEKYYIGINEGKTENAEWVSGEGSEDGRAVTFVKPVTYSENYNISLNIFKLVTGKKHQIRKQSAFFGFPLAGDKKYGSMKTLVKGKTYFLHAYMLRFPQNFLPEIPVRLFAAIPNDFFVFFDKNFFSFTDTDDIFNTFI